MRITKADVIWNYIGVFLTLGSNFLLLPFIIYFLDENSLGLWYIFLSIGGLVVLFDFGFNPTLARNVAYCWSGSKELSKVDVVFSEKSEPNFVLLNRVIKTSKIIYLLISLIALILLLTIGTFYITQISHEVEGSDHIIAWLIYCIALFLNLYYGYYSTFLRGVGAIKEINIAIILSRILQILISIILLFLNFGIIAVATAYLANGVIFRLISKYFFYKFQGIGETLKSDANKVNNLAIIDTFKLIWHNAWRDGLVSLSNYLSNQATILISSMYLSLSETGMYSISIQLVTAIAAISGALYTSYQPSLQAAYVNHNTKKSKELMSMAMTIYILTFWIGIVGLIAIGIPLISFIQGSTNINIKITIAISVYIFLLRHHSFYASFISNTNKVPYVKSFVISSVVGILVATICISYFNLGIWGLIFAQILVQAVYNNWKWPHSVMRELNTNIYEMFCLSFLRFINLFKDKSRKNVL
ncbi:O-antigen/teichoic acid export membrane protein [Paenibacillus sp. PastF-3]|uniref:O-unit flippase-like protein n=1 Tax=Paenibacillus sp. PastF-3 TaxID=2940626 RepID=UPI002472F92C|nr:O-unit flippase-like protein [Paenibacillus sp. PastF-3]MDH6373272.1 O-antigen/teichoic acid export membrane protein [Paenibacillus sp. PastF-3]